MIGKLIGGRYQIITTLSSGGFGQTFIAEDRQQFNLRCIVKKLKFSAASSATWSVATRLFAREAKIQCRLGHHDQIPRLLAYFQENQQFYLVQELIEGHSLGAEIYPGKRWHEANVIALLQDILEPLAFVHQQQVIHRDIKPSNLIRRDQDHKIVLIDFGAVTELAATQVLNSQGATNITTTIGTPGYMPSEQSHGQARFSSDIYAVGIIGIQALTGKSAQELPQDFETAELIWRQLTPVNSELVNILERMVRYDFRARYPSASEALLALQRLSQKSFISKAVSSIKHQVTPLALKPKLSWLIETSIAALILGLGGWYLFYQLPLNLTLKTIQAHKEQGNYQKCISLSQSFSNDYAPSLQLESLGRDCHHLQAKSYLAKARQLAAHYQYEPALRELNRITPDTASYSEAQILLKHWDLTQYKFYKYYQSALEYIQQSEYSPAFDSLYLAAEQAINIGQSDLFLSKILKHEQGIVNLTLGHLEWFKLLKALEQNDLEFLQVSEN